MKKINRLIILLFSACFPALLLAFNGSFDVGYSEISRGMAGSGAALPQDTLIAAINPAGMVYVGHRIDTGLTIYFPGLAFSASDGVGGPGRTIIAPGYYPSLLNIFTLPDAGVNWMLSPKSSFGMSLYSLGGFGTTYKTLNDANINGMAAPGIFGAGTVRSMLREAVTSLTYARKITENYSWGLSLLLAAQTFKAQGLDSLAPLTTAFNEGMPVNNLSTSHTDYSVGAGIRGGVMGKVLPNLTLAASYQPVIPMTKFSQYSNLFPDGGSLNIPANGVVGMALQVKPKVFFTFDVQEIWYDTVAAYAHTDAALLNGTCMIDPSTCLGGTNGAGFGWRNLTAYKFGLQWQAAPGWIWRLGYNYSATVVRSNQLVENILAPGAIIEHLFSAGLTRTINKTNQLNLFAIFVPFQTVRGVNPFSGNTQTLQIRANVLGGGIGWTWLLPD